jgi:hypothetical protein
VLGYTFVAAFLIYMIASALLETFWSSVWWGTIAIGIGYVLYSCLWAAAWTQAVEADAESKKRHQ